MSTNETSNRTSTGHTPGPWRVHPATCYRGDIGQAYDVATNTATWDPNDEDRDEGTRGVWQFEDSGGARPYARIARTSDMGPEALANARLIALAPELAEALRELCAWFPDDMDDLTETEIVGRARALLARLEGKP